MEGIKSQGYFPSQLAAARMHGSPLDGSNTVPSHFRHPSVGDYHGGSLCIHCTKLITKKGNQNLICELVCIPGIQGRQSHNMRQLCDPKLTSVDHTYYNKRYDLCHVGFFPPFPTKDRKSFTIPAHECHDSCHKAS